MTIVLLLALACVALGAGLIVRRLRRPGIVLWQFGRFVNERPGIKGHELWSDEADVVEYDDFRYWIRLRPNPGINLPVIGYWSKANGRKRR